eukprot:Tamp_06770.p1 GENE.Tamp_06770~~Tamp_06770.p1  ORF type:complete len:499 (-),score=75.51 Tamp_06770:1141-2433(-)
MAAAAAEVGMLVRCLHSEDPILSRNGACRLKDMVVASNPDQRSNQDLIAGCDGAVDGLVNILQRGSPDGKYHACYCLAQLAWSNEWNSLLIPSTPGALDSLALILGETRPEYEHRGAREYAAITLGNCGANSEEGAQTIVKHTRVINALVECLQGEQESRMQETTVVALKNCAASSQEAAFLIANMDSALEQLKALALRDVHSRISDVVSSCSPSLPASCVSLAPPSCKCSRCRRAHRRHACMRAKALHTARLPTGRRWGQVRLKSKRIRARAQAMGAINSISRSPRAVPRLVQKGFRKEVLSNLLLSKDFEAAAELKKLTVAWFSRFQRCRCCAALLYSMQLLTQAQPLLQNAVAHHSFSDLCRVYRMQRGGKHRGIRPAEAIYAAAMDCQQGRQASGRQHGQVSRFCAAGEAVEQCQLQSALGGLSAL